MKVLDLGAGGGYTTELIARAVAPGGVVYMQNDPSWMPFLKDALSERFTHPAMQGVVRADVPFEEPVPAEAKDLDLAVINVIYHDVANMPVDRATHEQGDLRRAPARRRLRGDRFQRQGRHRTLRNQDAAPDRRDRGEGRGGRRPGFASTARATSCAIRTTRATGTPRPARRQRRASGGPAIASRSDSSSRTARDSEHLLDPGEQLGGAEWLCSQRTPGSRRKALPAGVLAPPVDDQEPRGKARIEPRELIAHPDRVAVGKVQVGDDSRPSARHARSGRRRRARNDPLRPRALPPGRASPSAPPGARRRSPGPWAHNLLKDAPFPAIGERSEACHDPRARGTCVGRCPCAHSPCSCSSPRPPPPKTGLPCFRSSRARAPSRPRTPSR